MNQEAMRRVAHVGTAVFILYYTLPDVLYGWCKEVLFILLVISITAFECVRVLRGMRIPLLRDYELRRIAAYCWALWGATVVLLLLPPAYGVPVFLSMALVDPVMGVMRSREMRPTLPGFLLSALIYASFLWGVLGYASIPVSVLASLLFVFFEGPRWRAVDDDFLTLAVPALALYAVSLFL